MIGSVTEVAQVSAVCRSVGLKQVQFVPPLHGAWSGPGVWVSASNLPGIGVAVYVDADAGEEVSGREGYRWHASSGVPAEVLATVIRAAREVSI